VSRAGDLSRLLELGSAWPRANGRTRPGLFGSTVTLARRICDAADGGQTLVSDTDHDLGAPLGFQFVEAGPRILEGFDTPTPVFELQRAHAR
jgi:class 3 adenylate cyclase